MQKGPHDRSGWRWYSQSESSQCFDKHRSALQRDIHTVYSWRIWVTVPGRDYESIYDAITPVDITHKIFGEIHEAHRVTVRITNIRAS